MKKPRRQKEPVVEEQLDDEEPAELDLSFQLTSQWSVHIEGKPNQSIANKANSAIASDEPSVDARLSSRFNEWLTAWIQSNPTFKHRAAYDKGITQRVKEGQLP